MVQQKRYQVIRLNHNSKIEIVWIDDMAEKEDKYRDCIRQQKR